MHLKNRPIMKKNLKKTWKKPGKNLKKIHIFSKIERKQTLNEFKIRIGGGGGGENWSHLISRSSSRFFPRLMWRQSVWPSKQSQEQLMFPLMTLCRSANGSGQGKGHLNGGEPGDSSWCTGDLVVNEEPFISGAASWHSHRVWLINWTR